MRSYVYLSHTKVESILAQVEVPGPRISRIDFKIAAAEFADNRPDRSEQLLARAEQHLATYGLIKDLDSAREAEYFYGTMPMRWGRVDCDWGEVGPDPTVMFVGRPTGMQVALYGSLQHVPGHEHVEGSTTGSYGFVLWDLIASRLNATEPGLVDGDYPGISTGRDRLDRWSEEKKQYETHSTLGIVYDRLRYDGHFEFLAIVHKPLDCSRAVEYREPARWVIGSPLFVARATPAVPTDLRETTTHDQTERRRLIDRLVG
jgi:hypothetical protein